MRHIGPRGCQPDVLPTEGQLAARRCYKENRENKLNRAARRREEIRNDPERREKQRQYMKNYWKAHRFVQNLAKDRYHKKLRREALKAYGGRCACCGEMRAAFLTFDHIHGQGTKHRRSDNKIRSNIHRYLRDHGYPKDFQLLCMNCNWAKGKYGYCPHTQRGRE